jgi:hypothetical protein
MLPNFVNIVDIRGAGALERVSILAKCTKKPPTSDLFLLQTERDRTSARVAWSW